MFKVEASSLKEYFDWDLSRRPCLVFMDKVIRAAAPELKRWFYKGSAAGEPGMRLKLIGYGSFVYPVKSGKTVKWPIISIALQKNYVSVYLSVSKDNEPILDDYRDQLGALKYGDNNFCFSDPGQLNVPALTRLFKDIEERAKVDHKKALVYSRTKKVR
jgi:hypothetical protein